MEFPIGNALTGVATVVAVVISNLLTSRSTTRERLWELRREGYSAILFELAAIERVCDAADSYIHEMGYMTYWEMEARSRHDNDINERMKKLRDRVSSDYLIFSDEFLSLFDEFERALQTDDNSTLPDDEHDTFCSAVRHFRPRLSALGRSEIASPKNFWRKIFGIGFRF
jgi:hypothetical protein